MEKMEAKYCKKEVSVDQLILPNYKHEQAYEKIDIDDPVFVRAISRQQHANKIFMDLHQQAKHIQDNLTSLQSCILTKITAMKEIHTKMQQSSERGVNESEGI